MGNLSSGQDRLYETLKIRLAGFMAGLGGYWLNHVVGMVA